METIWDNYYTDCPPAIEIDKDKTAYEAFRDTAKKYPERIALEYGKRKFTYEELLGLVDHYAQVLAFEGITYRDTAILSCRRMPHQIIAFYALNKIGCAVTFIMRSTGPDDFHKTGPILKASVMIFAVEIYDKFKHVLAHAPLKKIILAKSTDFAAPREIFNKNMREIKKTENFDPQPPKSDFGTEVVYWSDMGKGELPEVHNPVKADDTAVILMSGTASGSVRIVKFDSRAINAEASIASILLGEAPLRVFSFIRLDFSYGFMFALHTTLMSGNTYLINLQKDFEFTGYDIDRYKPDAIVGYPQMLTALVDSKNISTKALANIKKIYSCGNTMSGADYHKISSYFEKRHFAPEIIRLYGITETCSVCMCIPPNTMRPALLGVPLPGVRIKIINPENNSDCLNGTTGVIAIDTPAHMTCYADSEDDTLSVLRKLNDGRKWIVTGDIGTQDDEGLFYYGGTRRRVFDRGGMHIYPQFIEDSIRVLIGVSDCCAVPLTRNGETIIKVAVKPEPDYMFSNDKLNALKDEIDNMCQMEMPEPMCPDEYEFMAYLPTEKYGRVDHEKVIKMFEEEENEQKNS